MKAFDNPQPSGERMVSVLIALVSYLAVGMAVGLVGYLVVKGSGPLSNGFLGMIPGPSDESLLLIWLRTMHLVLAVTLMALPMGIGAGIYFSEYAEGSDVAQRILSAIGNLAEVPPIIYGLFGWAALRLCWGMDQAFLVLVLTCGIWLLPKVIAITYAAFQEVPVSFRRDSLALGATRWQTVFRAVLPYAKRNLTAGVFEGMARVSGEAAPIIMIAASEPGFGGKSLRVLSYHLYRSVVESPQVAREGQLGAALLLLLTALSLQSVGIMVRTIKTAPISSMESRERGRW